jgi:hypothetical protein
MTAPRRPSTTELRRAVEATLGPPPTTERPSAGMIASDWREMCATRFKAFSR